jgi:hypothetical protein
MIDEPKVKNDGNRTTELDQENVSDTNDECREPQSPEGAPRLVAPALDIPVDLGKSHLKAQFKIISLSLDRSTCQYATEIPSGFSFVFCPSNRVRKSHSHP